MSAATASPGTHASLGLGKTRPLVALLVGGLHLAVLGALVPSGNAMGVPEPVAVSIEREAEVPQEAAPAASEEALPPVAPSPEPLSEPVPAPAPVEAPPALEQEKPAVAVPKQAKITPPKIIPPKRKQDVVEREEAPRPRREAAKRENTKREPVQRAAPGEGRAAAPAGRASQAGTGGNSAAYAAKVRATLQGRANALGFEDVNASVGLSFVIGPTGSVSSASISRPSGDFKVDGALRRMLASSSFPPPPGGRFSGSVTVRIH
jgi:periplasmic protein TonB